MPGYVLISVYDETDKRRWLQCGHLEAPPNGTDIEASAILKKPKGSYCGTDNASRFNFPKKPQSELFNSLVCPPTIVNVDSLAFS